MSPVGLPWSSVGPLNGVPQSQSFDPIALPFSVLYYQKLLCEGCKSSCMRVKLPSFNSNIFSYILDELGFSCFLNCKIKREIRPILEGCWSLKYFKICIQERVNE